MQFPQKTMTTSNFFVFVWWTICWQKTGTRIVLVHCSRCWWFLRSLECWPDVTKMTENAGRGRPRKQAFEVIRGCTSCVVTHVPTETFLTLCGFVPSFAHREHICSDRSTVDHAWRVSAEPDSNQQRPNGFSASVGSSRRDSSSSSLDSTSPQGNLKSFLRMKVVMR